MMGGRFRFSIRITGSGNRQKIPPLQCETGQQQIRITALRSSLAR
jgi:hypothetical protein